MKVHSKALILIKTQKNRFENFQFHKSITAILYANEEKRKRKKEQTKIEKENNKVELVSLPIPMEVCLEPNFCNNLKGQFFHRSRCFRHFPNARRICSRTHGPEVLT